MTLPSPAAFVDSFQSSSRTRALGLPRKTPVRGSINHRDSAPRKLVGTFSRIITSIEHLRDVGKQPLLQLSLEKHVAARQTRSPFDGGRALFHDAKADRHGDLGFVQVGNVI